MTYEELLKLADDGIEPAVVTVMDKMRSCDTEPDIGWMAIAVRLLIAARALLRTVGGKELEVAILHQHVEQAKSS